MITVVTENDERMFNASRWSIDDHTLSVFSDSDLVAQYAPGGWQYVLRTDSEVSSQAQDSH